MPQMAPMNWILMFCIFVLTFIMFNIMNYFNFIYTPKIYYSSKTFFPLNWKW